MNLKTRQMYVRMVSAAGIMGDLTWYGRKANLQVYTIDDCIKAVKLTAQIEVEHGVSIYPKF